MLLLSGLMRKKGITDSQIAAFCAATGGSVVPTLEWCAEHRKTFDWEQFAARLLQHDAWSVYDRRLKLALRAHDAATADAIAKYLRLYAPIPENMRALMTGANNQIELDRALAFSAAWLSPKNDKAPCPTCKQLLPKAIPSLLKPGEQCANHIARPYRRPPAIQPSTQTAG